MKNNSKPAIKYKSLIGLVLFFYVTHSINLCGMFTRQPLPLRINPNVTKDQKQANSIQIKGSDGITTIPMNIAKMSKTLSSMLDDLGDIPKDPIPLEQYSVSAMLDIRNIISQRFTSPERVKDKIEHYSPMELIERFNLVHYLDFPSDIQNLFKSKIIADTKKMNFEEIIHNKDAIKLLDSNVPEFKWLITKAHTPYITIADNKGQALHVPENIYIMSEYFLGALRYNQKRIIIFNEYPIDLLRDLFDTIENVAKVGIGKKIENYSLNNLIENVNCLEFLQFSPEIQKPFYDKIYVLCKQIPWQDVQQQLEYLNPHLAPHIFVAPITNKLKFSLLKNALFNDDRKIKLQSTGFYSAFSPDNQLFATGGGFSTPSAKKLQICAFNNQSVHSFQVTPYDMEDYLGILKFSSDSKKLAVGQFYSNENSVSLYDIGDKGLINQHQQIIIAGETYRGVYDIAFTSNNRCMVSAHSRADENNIFLWTFNKNGTVNEDPAILISNQRVVSPIKINNDDTISVVSFDEKNHELILWIFDQNGTIKLKSSIISNYKGFSNSGNMGPCPVNFSSDQKIIFNNPEEGKSITYICDFNDINNITTKKIFSDDDSLQETMQVVLDNTIIVGKRYLPERLFFMDISDINKPIVETMPIKNCRNLQFSPDNKKMFFSSKNENDSFISILLMDDEEASFDKLKLLNADQLILIDKVLEKATDLPSLEDYEVPQSIIDLLKNVKLVP